MKMLLRIDIPPWFSMSALSPMHSMTSDTDEQPVACAAHCTGLRRIVYPAFAMRKAGHGNDKSMESMESHKAGFPPFPHSLEIPSGFPHYHGLDDWMYVFS
jgi:hypothetical protein